MKRITVFCGSSMGNNPIYAEIAYQLGVQLAKENIGLVYGGAKVGLMGKVADGVLSLKGEVIGIIPEFLKTKEVVHPKLDDLRTVESMHERKSLMNDLCDGVIALPGGFGTLEELFEMLTWGQLGLHEKPIALLNVNGYYDALITLLDNMVNEGFLKEINKDMVLVGEDISTVLNLMRNYKAPKVKKWITKEQT
ncbi:MAG: TIGR00730 family Rossman fold protein [Bacteroidota bacterium]